MNRRRRCVPGFALLDVLVALTLGGVTVLIAHATLTTVVDATQRAEEARQRAASAVAVRRELVSWLRAAVVSGSTERWDFFGKPRTTDGGHHDDILVISTNAPGPFTRGQLRLTLAIDRGSSSAQRGLVAYEGTARDARTGAASSESDDLRPLRVLIPGATGMSVRYLHAVTGGRAWTTQWASSSTLPDAVELSIFGDSVPPLLRFGIFVVPSGAQ